jgi:hypothetical protein
MDIDNFRLPQSPWFFTQAPTALLEPRQPPTVVPKKQAEPAPDSRFPGYAAPMSDARLVTDYRSRCEVNIPTGRQLTTRVFMQQNADAIISRSRARQAEVTGAGLTYDSRTVMPPVAYLTCSTADCGYTPNVEEGVGVERTDKAPILFGTFAPSYPSKGIPAHPPLTRVYEGGRNTPRGVF